MMQTVPMTVDQALKAAETYRSPINGDMVSVLADELKRLRGRALDLEALALCVLSVEENCANAQRYPNGCGECIYCQADALMLTHLPSSAHPSVEVVGSEWRGERT